MLKLIKFSIYSLDTKISLRHYKINEDEKDSFIAKIKVFVNAYHRKRIQNDGELEMQNSQIKSKYLKGSYAEGSHTHTSNINNTENSMVKSLYVYLKKTY